MGKVGILFIVIQNSNGFYQYNKINHNPNSFKKWNPSLLKTYHSIGSHITTKLFEVMLNRERKEPPPRKVKKIGRKENWDYHL